jgi:uncharacterized phage protein (TIGR02220 family)
MKHGPSFQLYAADLYIDTNEWTCEEVGAYTRLLMSEWVNGDLPTDPKRLARITGQDLKRFQKTYPQLKSKFQVNGNGRMVNLRLEETRINQLKYREKQSLRASSGWVKRNATADATADAMEMATHMPDGCSSSSSSVKDNTLSSVKEIIDFLNAKSGKNFSPKTKATIVHIRARLAEGKTVDDFKKVISLKCTKWMKDPKMCDFIRPETLFGSKFEAYLNEQKPVRTDPFN